jgi:ATP-dependent Clp protease ATP-binding subunit ClpX
MNKNDFDEFQKHLQKMFGGNLNAQTHFNGFQSSKEAPENEPTPSEEDPFEKIYNFNFKPKEIRDELDHYVVKQTEAKKVLSVAVCDHYNHVRRTLEGKSSLQDEYAKQNILVLGPTGVGKTYLLKCIARIIGVPFVKADATKFSETGYVGRDVEDMVRDLVKAADGNVELAEFGIIYIDEIDKLSSGTDSRGKDVNGRGVQINLLKLMEEAEVNLKSQMDMMGQMEFMMDASNVKGKKSRKTINTRHILFIVSGAFSNLAEQIQRRIAGSKIGFMSDSLEGDLSSYLSYVETADLVKYGFEPEFVGRLPVRVACESLIKDDLEQILLSSKGSILNQYREDFAGYDITFEIEKAAVSLVAEKACLEKTGARGLLTVLEKVFRNFKFELPSTRINAFKVSAETIEHPEKTLTELLEANKGLLKESLAGEIAEFSKKFLAQYSFLLNFTDSAVSALIEESMSTGKSIRGLCEDKFRDFPYGLKLVSDKSNIMKFEIDSDCIANPDKTLSTWVVDGFKTGGA